MRAEVYVTKDTTNGGHTGIPVPGTRAGRPGGALSAARIAGLVEGAGLRGSSRTVYAALLHYCDAEGRYRGHVDDFRAYSGLGYEAIRKALKRLRESGLIAAERRGSAYTLAVWRVVAIGPQGEGPTT